MHIVQSNLEIQIMRNYLIRVGTSEWNKRGYAKHLSISTVEQSDKSVKGKDDK